MHILFNQMRRFGLRERSFPYLSLPGKHPQLLFFATNFITKLKGTKHVLSLEAQSNRFCDATRYHQNNPHIRLFKKRNDC